ncbi:hypothetical protein [Deinococcus aestuarii]|uniref:hypothetical protein n=1 Tax=Deinococcus aestuarii TaxID=2774531 RepID=UPI001C0CB852|nr:hypothetical protein [Deinococcus aestuarii]
MSDSAQGPGRVFLSDSLGDTLVPVCRQDVTTQNLRLAPVVAVPVRALPVEPPQPEQRVLAQVLEDGYRQRVVGRARLAGNTGVAEGTWRSALRSWAAACSG